MSRRLKDCFKSKESEQPSVAVPNDESPEKLKRKPAKKSRTLVSDSEDFDFRNEEILPPQNGNSIKRYFSKSDKADVFAKPSLKSCSVTVQAVVHGSPNKNAISKVGSAKVFKKKKKKKTGIPSSQADLIEVVSSAAIDETEEPEKDTKISKISSLFCSPLVRLSMTETIPTEEVKPVILNCEANVDSSDGKYLTCS